MDHLEGAAPPAGTVGGLKSDLRPEGLLPSLADLGDAPAVEGHLPSGWPALVSLGRRNALGSITQKDRTQWPAPCTVGRN